MVFQPQAVEGDQAQRLVSWTVEEDRLGVAAAVVFEEAWNWPAAIVVERTVNMQTLKMAPGTSGEDIPAQGTVRQVRRADRLDLQWRQQRESEQDLHMVGDKHSVELKGPWE